MSANQDQSHRSRLPEYFKELSEAMSRDFFPDAGYSIRTFTQNLDGGKSNIFSVVRFEVSKGSSHKGKWFATTEFPADFQLEGDWLSLSEGNDLIRGLEERKMIALSGNKAILLDSKHEYRWNPLELVHGSNAMWNYGTEKPATLANYTTNGPFPNIEGRIARRFTSERLESFIWFNLVSDKKIRPTNCRRYTNPSVLIVMPHYHAWIESVTVEDKGISVRLASEAKRESWEEFSLTSKEYYHGGMESDLKSVAIDVSGKAHMESSGSDLSSVEVDLYYSPGAEDEGFWVDKAREDKKLSRSNVNLEIHEYFDLDSNHLQEMLTRPGTDATSFEWAVATLLHLAGYQVEWAGFLGGHKGGYAEIDIVASGNDDEEILAVECTVAKGDLNRKIQSIATKSVDFGSRLPGAKVTPVVCVPLAGEQLKAAGFEHGQSGSVRILSGSDLNKLLSEVRAGLPHESLAKKISAQYYII